jgi:predicted ABC-type ATPase
MTVLDPDAVARLTNPNDPSAAAITAGREILSRWEQLLERRVSFAVETTLAGIGPIGRMRAAREVGYHLTIYFVALTTPDLCVERVRQRVLSGGHHIPERDLRRRYERSMQNAPVALRLANRGLLLDNGANFVRTLAETESGRIAWQSVDCPAWAATVLSALS